MPWHPCSKIAHRTIQSTIQGKKMPVKRLSYLLLLFASLLAAFIATRAQNTDAANGRWTAEQANEWYAKQPWLVGANYIPSNAINELEMFQAETFDPAINDRELGLAESIGMNTMRVFLQDQLWTAGPRGFLQAPRCVSGYRRKPPHPSDSRAVRLLLGGAIRSSVRSIRRSRACTTRAGCRAPAWTSCWTRATTQNSGLREGRSGRIRPR